MGVFSGNRSHLGRYSGEEVTANENYIGSVGALQMTLECYQNDQAIFEAVLGMDFQEAAAVNEGVELDVYTEAVGGFADKIKEFVKKSWEKIKGLFQTFLTKFNSVVMRDNKAFVEKYKRTVITKDLSKMKYKWSQPKENRLAELKLSDAEIEVSDAILAAKGGEQEKINDELSSGDYLDNLLTGLIAENTDSKSFSKDFHSAMFEDEYKEEGLKSDRLNTIINILTEKKIISDIEKSKKNIDKYFSKVLRDIDKAISGIEKNFPSKSDETVKYDAGAAGKNQYKKSEAGKEASKLNTIYRVVSTTQTAINMYCSRYIEAKKFEIKQARAVFAKAASFNPKAVKESAILAEAAFEAAEYEVMSSFEDYSM